MITITVARRPLDGTVAKSALTWGTGGLNIDKCRIDANLQEMQGRSGVAKLENQIYGKGIRNPTDEMWQPANGGRWPANMILSHLPGCECTGTKKVKPTSVNGPGPVRRTGVHSEVGGHQTIGRQQPPVRGYAGDDGLETVGAWDCQPGCPVVGLDAQGGVTKSASRQPTGRSIYPTHGTAMQWNPNNVKDTTVRGFDDEGGVSRFFKTVKGG